MNRMSNSFTKIVRQAADGYLRRTVGILLCIFLAGCGRSDEALTIELGEPVETQSVTDEWAGDSESGVSQSRNGAAVSGETPAMLYVYVCGAVKEPGVVTLPEGSRCNDALEAAGGFAENAAREAVNLAKHVKDGEQLYFPTVEEAGEIASARQALAAGLVNINTADEELLCTLPGIGEAKAKAIILYREQNGDFEAAEDIMQVPGIKENAYNQLKDFIIIQ